jgi:hypothetical protein
VVNRVQTEPNPEPEGVHYFARKVSARPTPVICQSSHCLQVPLRCLCVLPYLTLSHCVVSHPCIVALSCTIAPPHTTPYYTLGLPAGYICAGLAPKPLAPSHSRAVVLSLSLAPLCHVSTSRRLAPSYCVRIAPSHCPWVAPKYFLQVASSCCPQVATSHCPRVTRLAPLSPVNARSLTSPCS